MDSSDPLGNTSSARVLLAKLDELKALRQKIVAEHQLDDRLVERRRSLVMDEHVDDWRTRAVVAETRVADLEAALEDERRARLRLAEQNRKLDNALKQQREKSDRDMAELLGREGDLQQALKREKAKSKKTADSLVERITELGEHLDQSERDLERTMVSVRELEEELLDTRRERDEALGELKVLQARVDVLETKVLPKAVEDQRKLEAEMIRLREDLDDAIESETALRALFLQEQNSRMRRRSRTGLDLPLGS